MRPQPLKKIASIALLGLIAAGCASESAEQTTTTFEPTTTEASAQSVEVTAVDFAYIDLPAEVEAGTAFTLNNEAESELHELVAVKLSEDETRSVGELVMLPMEELGAIVEAGLTTVILAPPGGENIVPVGDGTLQEPGRYAIICFIPTGIAPQEYLDAVAETGEPPMSDSPPHFVHGMLGEVTVTEG